MIALVLGLLLLAATPAAAFSVSWETQHGWVISPGFKPLSYRYDLGVINDVLWVDLDLTLTGADPGPLWTVWETGAERIWSTDRFDVPIRLNVDRVTADADQVVHVNTGEGRWNVEQWYTVGVGGWGERYQDDAAAHEIGHMLGLYDEYVGGAVDPATGLVNTWGLMHSLAHGTLDYYYTPWLTWYDAHRPPTHVPEPATWLLVGAGLVGVGAWRRQQRRVP